MSNEIELKFEISSASIPQVISFLNAKPLLAQSTLQLSNTYYDTKDHYLRDQRSSVRIRGTQVANNPVEYEITVKSAGNAIAGLHERAEFNADLPSDKLDLHALPKQAFNENIDLDKLSTELKALFTTNFQRQVWLIQFEQSEIEIALDQGTIANATHSVPIQEVELELKKGNRHDLLQFALALCQFNLHLFSQSKAARGYRLLNPSPLKSVTKFDSGDLLSLLSYWQSNEESALESLDLPFYQQTMMNVKMQLAQWLEQNPLSIEINEIFALWSASINTLADIKQFAFSEVNSRLKLHLILLSFQNQ